MIAITWACQGCGACLLTCPERAIRPAHQVPSAGPLAVLAARCTGCGECVEICPADAIEFTGFPMITLDFTLIRRQIHRDHAYRPGSGTESGPASGTEGGPAIGTQSGREGGPASGAESGTESGIDSGPAKGPARGAARVQQGARQTAQQAGKHLRAV